MCCQRIPIHIMLKWTILRQKMTKKINCSDLILFCMSKPNTCFWNINFNICISKMNVRLGVVFKEQSLSSNTFCGSCLLRHKPWPGWAAWVCTHGSVHVLLWRALSLHLGKWCTGYTASCDFVHTLNFIALQFFSTY